MIEEKQAKQKETESKNGSDQGDKDLDQDVMLRKRSLIQQDEDEAEALEAQKAEIKRRRKKNPLFQGCNSIENYLYLNKIHEGSYGVVFRAQDAITGHIYAIKNIKIENDSMG